MATDVPVKPDSLIWARLSLGLSREQAAELFETTPGRVQEWESTEHRFTISQLREFARRYKTPVAAFLRSTTPTLPGGPEDYRTVGGTAPALTIDTLIAIRDAQRVQAIASDLLRRDPSLLVPASMPQVDFQKESPDEMALLERREKFAFDVRDQLSWPNANYAYNAWKARLQFLGVVVLVKAMPREDCRGFALVMEGAVPSVVVVNQKEVDQAKTFTLFHEYAHLMMRRHGICLEREDVDRGDVERWCNRFAASLLVPADALADIAPNRSLTIDDVGDLARRFKVSRPVIALSLIRSGRATEDLYAEIQRQSDAMDWSVVPTTSDEGFPLRAQDQIRSSELGYAYPHLVIAAWHKGLIGTEEACDYLDVRADKLPDLYDRTQGIAARYA